MNISSQLLTILSVLGLLTIIELYRIIVKSKGAFSPPHILVLLGSIISIIVYTKNGSLIVAVVVSLVSTGLHIYLAIAKRDIDLLPAIIFYFSISAGVLILWNGGSKLLTIEIIKTGANLSLFVMFWQVIQTLRK